MPDYLVFPSRDEFRSWLEDNGTTSSGVWLLFGKKNGPKTLTACEALEEALCFGWIDGQMKSLDETKYIKYFARRIAKSKWSEKNKKLVQPLIDQKRMTARGMEAIEAAKKNGMWDAPKRVGVSDEDIAAFFQLVLPHEPAYANLLAMSPSVQKTYAGFYYDAKSPKTRQDRLEKIIDRLHKNLKPM